MLINDLATALDGHGGIASIVQNSDYTITITFADETTVTTSPVRGATGAKGDKGADGRAITSVTKTGTNGLVDTYKIAFSDKTSTTFTVTNGRSITKVEKTDTTGLVDTYKISFSDNTSFNLSVTNGSSIKSIAKTGTSGLEDTYTVTLTDDTTSTFTVKNGNGIASIALQSGTHSPGTTDMYKITFTNGEYTTFPVYNGLNGAGSVVKVNGKDPNVSGNVALTGADIPFSASDSGTVAAKINDRLPVINNAGAHNAVYRGKYLGTSVTAAQWAAIANGTFADLYIGDYWTINEVNWRIAAFDYYYKTGDGGVVCTTHHVVIVPDTSLYDHVMNDTDITTGGYIGSKMYTEGLAQAKTKINTAFRSSHILPHRQFLTNAVTNGKPSGGSWYDSTVELMSEQNVYGGKIFGAGNDGSTIPNLTTIDKSQFPLFAFRPDLISNRITFWLRDVVSATYFAYANDSGRSGYTNASNNIGVRPAFSIKS